MFWTALERKRNIIFVLSHIICANLDNNVQLDVIFIDFEGFLIR